jgi:pSer/pThr/pTyr-binding forkhead associated (FHA) protein
MQNQTDKPPAGTPADQNWPETTALDQADLLENLSRSARLDRQSEAVPTPYWGSNMLLESAVRLQLEVQGDIETLLRVSIQDYLVIGRAASDAPDQPHIDLTPYGAQRQGVSRRHVMIIKEGNLLKVADLGSTNGTYLNGVRLQPNQPRLLRTGDRLSLGELVLKVSSLT